VTTLCSYLHSYTVHSNTTLKLTTTWLLTVDLFQLKIGTMANSVHANFVGFPSFPSYEPYVTYRQTGRPHIK